MEDYKDMKHGINSEYANGFLKTKEAKDDGSIINVILKMEEVLYKNISEWQEKELMEYLKEFKSISVSSLNAKLNTLRNFARYIRKLNGSNEAIIFHMTEEKVMECIDLQRLLSLTINYYQYCDIKSQLSFDWNGNDYNVRDKVMFELAWLGLTHEDIQKLKEIDIEFSKNSNGDEVIFLNLAEGKIVKVEEEEIIEDIKKVLKEEVYIINSSDGRTKTLKYKDSEYLLKPVAIGRSKANTSENWITNPALTLLNVFRNVVHPVTSEGVDTFNLTLSDIRRSKLIYLLSEDNSKWFDMNLITVIFGLKSETHLHWLREFAKEKYKTIK